MTQIIPASTARAFSLQGEPGDIPREIILDINASINRALDRRRKETDLTGLWVELSEEQREEFRVIMEAAGYEVSVVLNQPGIYFVTVKW